jgi:hypothetical protein
VRAPAGADDEEVAALARAAADAEEDDARPRDPRTLAAAESGRRALVDALRAAAPALREAPLDHALIARETGVSEGESRRRYRWTVLEGPEEPAGIQITLYDEWATITMPWGAAGSSPAAMAELWRYLEVLTAAGGYTVYDPTGDNVVDVAAGPDGGRAPEPPRAAGRPWWKFW